MATILVVDDKRPHRKFIADVLKLEGYEVEVAESGPQALAMLNQQRFDLITLDQQMPGMTGLECYSIIKAQNSPMRVVFITIFGDESDFKQMKRRGIIVLVKPLTPGEIVAAITTALNTPLPGH